MKKIMAFITTVLLILSITGCASQTAKSALNEGKLSVAKGDYTTALNYFRLAENEGANDKTVQETISILDNFIKAKAEFDNFNMDGASAALEAVPNSYKNYSIADDIDKLKQDISNTRSAMADIDSQIAAVKTLIANGDYVGASANISELYTKNLTIYQKKQVDELKSTIETAQSKIADAKNSQPAVVYVPQTSSVIQSSGQRPDLLNTSLTYKRMSGINNTTITSDSIYESIKNIIIQFDMACERYMNDTGGIPAQLRSGSTAYNQQTNYKSNHPSLRQTYSAINVINTRMGGGYYYAWVTETLNITENGSSKTETDHWVYKLVNISGNWYIEDYTRDPAY